MQAIKFVKTLCTLVMLASLSACSMLGLELFGEEGFFRDRQGDYLEAESIPRINVPDDKDSYIIDDLLVIPNLPSTAGDAFVQVPRPRPLQGNPDQSVVIQSMNESSWVVVDASVSEVWPRLRQYWLENDIELAQEDAVSGLLETNWFIKDGDTETQEKFRLLVEPGFQNESAEVSLIHISLPQEELSERVNWPDQSMDIVYATEILGEISIYLANEMRNYQASTVSFLAGNTSSEGRASIMTEDGINMLHLRADYERSWAAVGRALERADIEIIEEDVDAGFFSVIYGETLEEVEEPGFIGRLMSVGRGAETNPFSVFLEQTESGINVIALREVDLANGYSDDFTEENSNMQEQQTIELINNLIQSIQDFI